MQAPEAVERHFGALSSGRVIYLSTEQVEPGRGCSICFLKSVLECSKPLGRTHLGDVGGIRTAQGSLLGCGRGKGRRRVSPGVVGPDVLEARAEVTQGAAECWPVCYYGGVKEEDEMRV